MAEFEGEIEVYPPLNANEVRFLNRFSETRRMDREQGPYYVDDPEPCGQGHDGVIDYNRPPPEQPGLWCQWVVSEDGTFIAWDECEKFYSAAEWMMYIIQHFIMTGAFASQSSDMQFADFTFNHVCNGVVEAVEEDGEQWRLVVEDNVVKVSYAVPVFTEPRAI